MSNDREITIVNLCYNTGRYVLDTLEAIKAQTFRNFELIVVDDYSTDNSKELVDNWIRENEALFPISFLRNDENLGICRSLNNALKQAKGKYLAIIGDDYWHPEFLERLYNVLSSAPPTICMAYAKADVVDYFTKERGYWLDPMKNVDASSFPNKDILFQAEGNEIYRLPGSLIQQCLFYSNCFIAFSGLIKLDLLRSIGGYNEAFSFEDLPTWFSLSRNYDFLYVDRYLATYVRHEESFTVKSKPKLYKSVIDIYLHNSNLARDKEVKTYFHEITFQYWYKLYSDNGVSRKELLPYTMKLMTFSGIFFRKFSSLFIHKISRDVRKRLFSKKQLTYKPR